MTATDSAAPTRRRIGIKGPLTGLVLVAIVVYGSYWGWQKAFGETGTEIVSNGCPTVTPTTTAATTTPPATTPAAAGLPAAGFVAVNVAATTAPPAAPTTTAATPAFLAAADVQVNVFNATARPGLAANTAAVLRDRGFNVQTVDNAPADDVVPEVAQIRAAVMDSPQVRLLVQHVPGAIIVPDGRADATVDLVLGDLFASLGDPALVTPVPLPAATC